jgi:hypothetical protein
MGAHWIADMSIERDPSLYVVQGNLPASVTDDLDLLRNLGIAQFDGWLADQTRDKLVRVTRCHIVAYAIDGDDDNVLVRIIAATRSLN